MYDRLFISINYASLVMYKMTLFDDIVKRKLQIVKILYILFICYKNVMLLTFKATQ